MKVLAIDDQRIVLMYLKKCLIKLGYEVKVATSGHMGISIMKEFQPDVVMVDFNMPSISGLGVVEHIRKNMQSNIPIIMLSGNDDPEVVSKAFNYGANDYIRKPVSLKEISARLKAIANSTKTIKACEPDTANQFIQDSIIGVVIPCYNEEKRLPVQEFRKFLHENLGYHLCFVNDGSSDRTIDVLLSIKEEFPLSVSVHDCKQNGGKAEAVRKGAMLLTENTDIEYIGYLDADLSTDFIDFKNLMHVLKNSDHRVVSGSRMLRMGAKISKDSARAIISKMINLIIRFILKMPFNDTQCGAKIMDVEIAKIVFNRPFLTRWLFDVEIFKRIGVNFGRKKALEIISESPLDRWVHVDDSKLSMKDSFKIFFQLFDIYRGYKTYSLSSKESSGSLGTEPVFYSQNELQNNPSKDRPKVA